MKKYYILLIMLFSFSLSKAATQIVAVGDNFFSPANFTVNVGDTIVWQWMTGIHTTTYTTIPAGAAPWNAPIDASHQVFMYVVTESGNYSYQCNFHFQMGMVAQFTALELAGIEESVSNLFFRFGPSPAQDQIHISYSVNKSTELTLQLLDVIGKNVKTLQAGMQPAGQHESTFDIGTLPAGIYLLKLSASDVNIVRKIVVG